MKHFYICISVFFIIMLTGILGDIAVKNNLAALSFSADRIITKTGSGNIEKEAETIKDNFYNKKNMLLLFVSKEHIKELESEILFLENAVKSDDSKAVSESCIKIKTACEYSVKELTAFN